MEYKIPQDKIDKIIFKYLDNNLKGLEKRKPKYYEGIVFAYPDEEYGILGWKKGGTLYVHYVIIDEIFSVFKLEESDIESLIGRWVSDRLQLEVKNTSCKMLYQNLLVSDRLQLEVKNTLCSTRNRWYSS